MAILVLTDDFKQFIWCNDKRLIWKVFHIKIHCINVVNGSSSAMQRIANETGGNYYYAATTSSIKTTLEELTRDTIDSVDMTDSDGDGLYDVYEINGMRLSNGQVVYTDPNNADSDGDGINDFDAMGDLPVVEEYFYNGESRTIYGDAGIYNNADAAVTLHCVYDSVTDSYSMEYIYYIIDLYDFTLYDDLDVMNALGLARCYELYGVSAGVSSWNRNDPYNYYWMF